MGLNIRGMRWPWLVGAVAAAVLVVVGLCEAAGWPFLVGPAQRWLSSALERRVVFGDDADSGVRIGLLGSVRVEAGRIEIDAPEWSKSPHMVLARKARLQLGYGDLLKAYRGGVLRVRELHADSLDARLERETDGRASWQFGKPKPEEEGRAVRVPSFGELRVVDGSLLFRDAVLAADLDAKFSLTERGTGGPLGGDSSAASAPPVGSSSLPAHLHRTRWLVDLQLLVVPANLASVLSRHLRRNATPLPHGDGWKRALQASARRSSLRRPVRGR